MNGVAANVETGLVQRTHALGLTLEEIRGWLAAGHTVPLPAALQSEVCESLDDLAGRVRKLQAEPTLLVVVFMGGTGVGKSTLLNALAGAKIAESSMVRPTTRQSTVFHHRDVDLSRLDPLFGKCKAAVHDRAELRRKILIDTPDIDGNVVEHHERLREMLPLADAVLYVGSQEKYHDREGWKLLLENRDARGFAFVLNKWDRCLGLEGDRAGTSPLDDFRKTLAEAGFAAPLIFRTCAGQWAALAGTNASGAIEDDFQLLTEWLDRGLDDAAVRAIKSRGIAGALDNLVEQLDRVRPPVLAPKVDALKSEWTVALQNAVKDEAAVLVGAADRHANAFESHLRGLGRQRFKGLFAQYLNVVDWIARPKLSAALPSLPRRETAIGDLADRCVASIPAETRHALEESVHNRLLSIADQRGFPVAGLESRLPADRDAWLSNDVLLAVAREELMGLEKDYSEPSIGRAGLQGMVAGACNWLPWVAIGYLVLQFLYDALWKHEIWGIGQLIGSFLLLTLVFVGLHFFVNKIFPVHWDGLRAKLERDLERRLADSISPVYFDAVDKVAKSVTDERARLQPALDLCRSLRDELNHLGGGDQAQSLFART